MKYTIKKLASDFKIIDGSRTFTFSGFNWGVFDSAENLHYSLNNEGKKLYDVFGYKYVAQHQADFLNNRESEKCPHCGMTVLKIEDGIIFHIDPTSAPCEE